MPQDPHDGHRCASRRRGTLPGQFPRSAQTGGIPVGLLYASAWQDGVFRQRLQQFQQDPMGGHPFGNRLPEGNFAKDLVPDRRSALEKASELLATLQGHFVWNGVRDYFSYTAGAKAFKDKTGTAADINLSLVAGLTALGLDAYPVVLSTRGSGSMHPEYPNFEKMNYVVALVKIDGKEYFADATKDFAPRLAAHPLPERGGVDGRACPANWSI